MNQGIFEKYIPTSAKNSGKNTENNNSNRAEFVAKILAIIVFAFFLFFALISDCNYGRCTNSDMMFIEYPKSNFEFILLVVATLGFSIYTVYRKNENKRPPLA
jgi:hypothetical protein